MLQARTPPQTRSFAGRCGGQLDLAPVAASVAEANGDDTVLGEARGGDVGPLDEGDPGRVEVVVEQRRFLFVEAAEAVEVEVGDGKAAALVALADREGGRGDRAGDAKRMAGATDQGRLAGAELAAEDDHVAGTKAIDEAGAKRFGLGGRAGRDDLAPGPGRLAHPKKSSWSAEGSGCSSTSASSSGSSLGTGGPIASRPGKVAKSSRNVSLTAGVRSAAAG